MTEKKIFNSKYLRIWQTFDDFGFSVILNFDYIRLIVRFGSIVLVIGSQEDNNMMICPYCGNKKTHVFATCQKWNEEHDSYKRYRRCNACGNTFSTLEKYEKEYIKYGNM